MGILIWGFTMHSENGRISRQASPIKSTHSEQGVIDVKVLPVFDSRQ